MVEFTLVADSRAPAEDVLAAARDFSRRRIAIWPNVSARRFAVHASGETFVEATEAALQGLFWERSRYEWPRPGSVHQTVLDSNVLRPGSTWQITAVPNGDGCRVECVFRREFVRSPKGWFGWAVNRFGGDPLYGGDLRRAVAAIERRRDEHAASSTGRSAGDNARDHALRLARRDRP